MKAFFLSSARINVFEDFVQKFCECKVATELQNCSLRSVITLHVVFAQNEINPGKSRYATICVHESNRFCNNSCLQM